MTWTQIHSPSRCIWVGKTKQKEDTAWPEVEKLMLWAGSKGLVLASPPAPRQLCREIFPALRAGVSTAQPGPHLCLWAPSPRSRRTIPPCSSLKLTLMARDKNHCPNVAKPDEMIINVPVPKQAGRPAET